MAHINQAVLEPDNAGNIDQLITSGMDVFAYVSVGEINPSRAWFADIPKHWLLSENAAWGSHIVDLGQQAWHDHLINKLMAPLRECGYRGFFLDTLDSYQLVSKDAKHNYAQQQALVKLIREMHQRFPDVKLILNRGFELLPDIAEYTLFQGWNAKLNNY